MSKFTESEMKEFTQTLKNNIGQQMKRKKQRNGNNVYKSLGNIRLNENYRYK